MKKAGLQAAGGGACLPRATTDCLGIFGSLNSRIEQGTAGQLVEVEPQNPRANCFSTSRLALPISWGLSPSLPMWCIWVCPVAEKLLSCLQRARCRCSLLGPLGPKTAISDVCSMSPVS